MMAQPRLQFVNATGRLVKSSLGLRAAFSSSSIVRADEPPRRSSAAADLLALDDRSTSRRGSQSQPRSTPLSSIALPGQNTPQTGRSHKVLASQAINNILRDSREKRARFEALRKTDKTQANRLGSADEREAHARAQDLSRQITRRWKAGDVYAPKDIGPVEMAKWKKRARPDRDVFDVLQFDPTEHYKNFSIMSEYMTPMGRIKHSKETGLRPVNQRKIAKAIRRSIGLGLMPSVHRHPELLHKEALAVRSNQMSPLMRGPGF